MNIAVIAADGRSGQAFVRQAAKAGHHIKAGIRGPNPFVGLAEVTPIKCDATKPADLLNLIKGSDAVVSLIGHIKGSPADVQTKATQNTIKAMNELKVNRLVSLTGTGARFAGDKITLTDRFLNLGVSIMDPVRVKDGRAHVELLKQSGLNWTVIRVLKLQDVAAQPFRLSEHGPTKPFVGRDEVAIAILEVLSKASFISKAPIISKP